MNSIKAKHHGVVVPMVTPFLDDGSLDIASAEKIVDHLASAGVGIFVLGTTGEAASLPQSQRTALVELSVKVSAGRALVYAGIGSNCTETSITSGRGYLSLGADAVVAHLPGYYLLDAAEMREYFEFLALGIGERVILYNMPQTTRMSLPIEVLAHLADHPAIIGLKDSENSPGRPEQVAERLCGREDFTVFMGASVLSARALRLGFDGLVPSSGNIVPAPWARLLEAAKAGDWQRVEQLQTWLDSVARVFQRDRSLAQSLGALKACMTPLGLCTSMVRPPLRRPTPAQCEALSHEIEALLATQPT